MIVSPDEPAPNENAVERFAAHCAHDFNNFLTAILGNLELMQNRAKRQGITEFDSYLEGARHAAGRAALFAQRLLAYSGRAAQQPVLVQVNQLTADLAALFSEQPGSNGEVSIALAPDAGLVFCDPAQLEMALLELLTNAKEAGGAAAQIRIDTAVRGDQVIIAVTDNGPGMTPEVVSQATAAFFSSRPSSAGKGLGLSIIARFARQAGGTLEFHGELNAGMAVQLILPRRPG